MLETWYLCLLFFHFETNWENKVTWRWFDHPPPISSLCDGRRATDGLILQVISVDCHYLLWILCKKKKRLETKILSTFFSMSCFSFQSIYDSIVLMDNFMFHWDSIKILFFFGTNIKDAVWLSYSFIQICSIKNTWSNDTKLL